MGKGLSATKKYGSKATNHSQLALTEGLGTSLEIMGLATYDPHSQK